MNYIRESPVNFQKYNLNLKTFADTSKKWKFTSMYAADIGYYHHGYGSYLGKSWGPGDYSCFGLCIQDVV
jgi:hypothetical protein